MPLASRTGMVTYRIKDAYYIVTSVSQVYQTSTGVFNPSVFRVYAYKGKLPAVGMYLQCWGSTDNINWTYITYKVLTETLYYIDITVKAAYKYYIVRLYDHNPSTDIYNEPNFYASASVSVIKDGEPGAQGNPGAKMRMRTWASGTYYMRGVGDEEWYDVVEYEGRLYLCRVSHTSSSSNSPATDTGYWETAQNWTFIATKLLLAEKIKANMIDADGLEAKNANITGKIYAEEGELGKMTIKADTADDGLYLKDDTYGSEMSLKSRMYMGIPYNVFDVNPGRDNSNVLLYVKKRRGNSLDRALYVDGVAEVYGRLGVGKGKNTGFNQFSPALVAEGISCYGQFCLPVKTVTSTSSLDSTSSYVVLNFSSSGGYIRLPSTNLTDGQTIIIRNIGPNNVTVYGNMKNERNDSITQYTFSTGGRLHVHTYYQNGSYWIVNNLN